MPLPGLLISGGKRTFTSAIHGLLSRTKDILPKESNILKFQNFFRIVRTDFDERQAEQRIFGTVQENPEKYRRKTFLQGLPLPIFRRVIFWGTDWVF